MDRNRQNKRRNTHSEQVDVVVWRERFQNVIANFSARGEAFKILQEKDDHFSTKDGVFDWSNVRTNKAGIVATSRVVMILEKHLASKKAAKSYMKKIKSAAL